MKLAVLLFIIVVMMVSLNIAGVNTTSGYVLNYLDIVNNPQNLQNTDFYNTILTIFTIALAGGVVVSFLTRSSPEAYLVAPLAGILILFVGDIISVVTYVSSLRTAWINYILLPIMAGLAVTYLISVVDFWRGVDG